MASVPTTSRALFLRSSLLPTSSSIIPSILVSNVARFSDVFDLACSASDISSSMISMRYFVSSFVAVSVMILLYALSDSVLVVS